MCIRIDKIRRNNTYVLFHCFVSPRFSLRFSLSISGSLFKLFTSFSTSLFHIVFNWPKTQALGCVPGCLGPTLTPIITTGVNPNTAQLHGYSSCCLCHRAVVGQNSKALAQTSGIPRMSLSLLLWLLFSARCSPSSPHSCDFRLVGATSFGMFLHSLRLFICHFENATQILTALVQDPQPEE